MDGKSLVAELGSVNAAAKLAKELDAFFAKVALEVDRAAKKAGGERPEEATPLAIAFGKKHGIRWEESPTWGHEDWLAGHEPEVGSLGASLALFHDDLPGGFGAEIPALLKKAGAKVRVAARPPLVYGELPASSALVKKLTPFFEQRLSGNDLKAWGKPPWSKRVIGIGRAADVRFAVDSEVCAFVLPLQPSSFEPLREALEKAGGAVRIATLADEKAVTKREASRSVGPTKPIKLVPRTAAKPTAIPTAAPKVERVPSFAFRALFSTGATIYAVRRNDVASGPTPEKLRTIAKRDAKDKVTSIFADDAHVYAGGNALWRGKVGAKSLTKLKMPAGLNPEAYASEFDGIGKDPSGVVWAGGESVVTVRGDKVTRDESFGKDANLNSLVTTPIGVLLLSSKGLAYLANDGKAARLTLRGKGHLSAACVTPRGTVIVVGSGAKWSAEIYRSEDGGRTFKPVRVAKLRPLNAVATLPDGRLVAGGGDVLLYSVNDGKTWKPAKTPTSTNLQFDLLCAHGSAVIGEEVRIR